MTRRLETTGRYPVEPERMLRVLSHPQVIEEQKKQQGAVSVQVYEVERSAARLVQRVETVEYHRGMTGWDRKRTVPAETRYEWDLPGLRCAWRYRGERGDQVRLEGSIAVRRHPVGSQVDSGFEIEVRVALIGRAIEALIAREVESGFADFDALLQRRCQEVD
jgi:hypothetical protein